MSPTSYRAAPPRSWIIRPAFFQGQTHRVLRLRRPAWAGHGQPLSRRGHLPQRARSGLHREGKIGRAWLRPANSGRAIELCGRQEGERRSQPFRGTFLRKARLNRTVSRSASVRCRGGQREIVEFPAAIHRNAKMRFRDPKPPRQLCSRDPLNGSVVRMLKRFREMDRDVDESMRG